MTVKSQHYNIYSSAQSLNKRGNKKVKPVYEDNGDCVLLYACGWQVMSCVENIFAEIFFDDRFSFPGILEPAQQLPHKAQLRGRRGGGLLLGRQRRGGVRRLRRLRRLWRLRRLRLVRGVWRLRRLRGLNTWTTPTNLGGLRRKI